MIEPDIIGKFYRYKQRSEDENGILIDDSFPISEAARKNNYVFAKQKTRHLRIDMKVNFRTPMDGRGSMQKRRFGFAKTRVQELTRMSASAPSWMMVVPCVA